MVTETDDGSGLGLRGCVKVRLGHCWLEHESCHHFPSTLALPNTSLLSEPGTD